MTKNILIMNKGEYAALAKSVKKWQKMVANPDMEEPDCALCDRHWNRFTSNGG